VRRVGFKTLPEAAQLKGRCSGQCLRSTEEKPGLPAKACGMSFKGGKGSIYERAGGLVSGGRQRSTHPVYFHQRRRCGEAHPRTRGPCPGPTFVFFLVPPPPRRARATEIRRSPKPAYRRGRRGASHTIRRPARPETLGLEAQRPLFLPVPSPPPSSSMPARSSA
jgi:hypothetical protein